jgi:hypothetical protein
MSPRECPKGLRSRGARQPGSIVAIDPAVGGTLDAEPAAGSCSRPRWWSALSHGRLAWSQGWDTRIHPVRSSNIGKGRQQTMSPQGGLATPAGSGRLRSNTAVILAAITLLVAGCSTTAKVSPPASTIHQGTPDATAASVTPPSISGLGSIVCSSSDHCLAMGTSVDGQATMAITATTTDGGAHWAGVWLPERIDQLTGLSCVSSNRCVAVGGRLVGNNVLGRAVTTSDGGLTWRTSILPQGLGAISDVSCPTDTSCVAVGATPDGTGGIALTSRNLGVTWTTRTLPEGQKSLAQVDCASSISCIAVGGGQSGSGEMLVTTSDGGRSWATTSLPVGHDESGGIACPSTIYCFAVGSETPGDGSPSGLIFGTSNGGTSWTTESVPSGTTYLLGIACPTTVSCVVVGGGILPRGGPGAGTILTTSNGGAVWTPRAAPVGVGGLNDISCPTLNDCVATGENPSGTAAVVASTDNGGATWSGFSL